MRTLGSTFQISRSGHTDLAVVPTPGRRDRLRTRHWVECEDSARLEEFRKKAHDNLALDGGGYLTYLAPTRVNLSLTEERWPEIEFRATREH